MPTRRGYRRRVKKDDEPSAIGTAASKVGGAIKTGTKKVLEGYLAGTQKLADKVESVLPESMTSYDRSGRGGRGRGGRGMRGRGR